MQDYLLVSTLRTKVSPAFRTSELELIFLTTYLYFCFLLKPEYTSLHKQKRFEFRLQLFFSKVHVYNEDSASGQ